MLSRVIAAYRAAFSGLPADVWRLALALLVNRSGAMVMPFLGLYVTTDRGWPASAAAAVLFAYGVGSVAGTLVGGALCNRIGTFAVQRASLIGSGVLYLAIPFTRGLPDLVAVVACGSMVTDAFRPALMTAAADAAPSAVRARAMALVRLAANLGFAVGPTVGGLLASLDYRWLFVVDALSSWAACLILVRTLAPRERVADTSGTSVAAHRDGPFLALLAISFVLTLALFQTFSTLPIYLHRERGFAERTIGLLLGMNGLLIVLFEMLLVQRFERAAPLRIFAVGALLLCGGLALLPLGGSVAFTALALGVMTFGEMLSLPQANTLAASRGADGQRGSYMGLYSSSFSAAFVVAPALGLYVIEHLGGRALWFGIGGLAPVLAVGCLLLARVPWGRGAEATDIAS